MLKMKKFMIIPCLFFMCNTGICQTKKESPVITENTKTESDKTENANSNPLTKEQKKKEKEEKKEKYE
mgnify:CR=1 FL=1